MVKQSHLKVFIMEIAASALLMFTGGCKTNTNSSTVITDTFTPPSSAVVSTIPGHAITAQQAKTLLDMNKTVVFVDVRDQTLYDSGHIPGAVLIPVLEIKDRLAEIPKNKQVVVYAECN